MAPFQDAPATPFADRRRESFFSGIFSVSSVREFVESARLPIFRLYPPVAHYCTVLLTVIPMLPSLTPVVIFSLHF